MRPREDDPSLYRANVLMSWQVMTAVIERVTEKCLIAHLNGGDYDCLSLVTLGAGGYPATRFRLNRNGINSTAVRHVWERIRENGVAHVADELIDASHLTRQNGQQPTANTVLIQLCRGVVTWIERNRDENFYVGPMKWPGNCTKLLPEPLRQYDKREWPLFEHGPEISVGLEGIEVIRWSQIDVGSIDEAPDPSPHQYVVQFANSGNVHYTSLDVALEKWGKLNNRKEVWGEIQAILRRLEDELGPMVDFHIPQSCAYVAVHFQSKPKNIGAYINVGHVDHNQFIEGSVYGKDRGNHRSFLTSTAGDSTSPKEVSTLKLSYCTSCYLQMPATGMCDYCG